MRSEANFRLRECQPRPGLGSKAAILSALFHQVCARSLLVHLDGFLGAGSTGASATPSPLLRASSKAASASAVNGVRCS